MAEPTCANCIALERRVAELEALVARLLGQLETLQRTAKRQAAPFAKNPPQEYPKTPGRKSGRRHGKHGHRPPPPPAQIDEKLDAPLPDTCPECGDDVQETHVATYFAPSAAPFMLNYRVRDLDAMLSQLRLAGAHVEERIEEYDYGRFGWAKIPKETASSFGNRAEPRTESVLGTRSCELNVLDDMQSFGASSFF
jgi:hypothetical protein